MVKPTILANTLTTVGVGLYVACRVLSLIVPDLIFNVGKSWFHTLSLDALQATAPFDIGTFLFGAVTFGVLTWVTAYASVVLYSQWSK